MPRPLAEGNSFFALAIGKLNEVYQVENLYGQSMIILKCLLNT